MPQIRVSATPLHIRADVLAKVFRIQEANVVLFEWIEYATFAEIVAISDAKIFDLHKLLADTAGIAEQIALAVGIPQSDQSVFTDAELFHIDKVLADNAALSEAATLALNKLLADTATATDTLALAVGQASSDSASVSEVAAIQFSRPAADSFSIIDAIVRSHGLGKANTASLDDFGSLLNQDYTGPLYFAEDYVGTSRTF
jgi:hypothetical protein